MNTDGPCPRGAHSLETEVRHSTQSAAVTPASAASAESQTQVLWVTERHGAASGQKLGQGYKEDAGWAFAGEAIWEKGHLKQNKEVHAEAGAHRELRKCVWAATSVRGRAVPSGAVTRGHEGDGTDTTLRSAELGALVVRH